MKTSYYSIELKHKNPKYRVIVRAIPEKLNVRALKDGEEAERLKRIDSGDMAAWFMTEVEVSSPGNNIASTACLGSCSWGTFESYFENKEKFDDLIEEATQELESQLVWRLDSEFPYRGKNLAIYKHISTGRYCVLEESGSKKPRLCIGDAPTRESAEESAKEFVDERMF